MKHLEELNSGSVFLTQNIKYIATCDFDNNKNRQCINLNNGHPRWLPLNTVVSIIDLYTLNENNEIISIHTGGSNDR